MSEQLAALARSVDAGANLDWEGTDADMFASRCEGLGAFITATIVPIFTDASATLRRQADAQDEVSATLDAAGSRTPSGGPGGNGAGDDRPRSHRLDDPEVRDSVLENQARYLERSSQRKNFPGAYSKADAWLKELQSGNPTPEQVAAFESYMALIKVSVMQQSIVEDAARHAWNEYLEAGKSGASAIGGATQLHESFPKGLSQQAFFEVLRGMGKDSGGGAIINSITDSAHIGDIGAESMVIAYRANADAMLQELEGGFRKMDGVGYTDPAKIAMTQYYVYGGQAEAAIQKAEFADAFTPLTGDGSALDSGLRGALRFVGGPAASKTLDGLAIAGGTAAAGYHIQSANAALVVASSGTDSVLAMAAALGAPT